jgi:hypothetical protein
MWSIFSKGRRIFFSPNLKLVNKGIERKSGSSLRLYKETENGYRYKWFSTDVPNPTNELDFNNLFIGNPNSFGITYNESINWTSDNIPSYLPSTNFAWEVTAYLVVDTEGQYQFNTRSDDGNQLSINDNIVTFFYGSRGMNAGETSSPINLSVGIHKFKYRSQQGDGGAGAEVRWKIPGNDNFVIIPPSAFLVNIEEITTSTTTTTTSTTTSPIVPLTVETFTTIGISSWTAPAGVNEVEYLIVAGGGGGGNGYDSGGGGGGGAGMVLTGTISVTPGNLYSLTVGDGGDGGEDTRSNRDGIDGSNSIFDTIIALGGGFGKGSRSATGTGTLGFGGAAQVDDISSAIGGNGGGGGNSGGGGGGAVGAGTNRINSSNAGTGGTGLISNITGSAVTYGTGGDGGTANIGTINGTNGSNNSGNGGKGGSSNGSDSSSGGKGGSGIIIIKYGS